MTVVIPKAPIKTKTAPGKVKQTRKTLFKAIAVNIYFKYSLNSIPLKQRADELLRGDVDRTICHLCLLIGLTQRQSKLSHVLITGGSFKLEQDVHQS